MVISEKTLTKLKEIADWIHNKHPDKRYKINYFDWNQLDVSITYEVIMKNPTEEALKAYIQEMRDHSAKVPGTLRQADNEGQEKILYWVIQNQVNEIIKICGLLGVIEEVKE